ncbi:MAG: abortive infection family protein [Bacteroidota bacterium]
MALKPNDRFNLITSIALKLQAEYNTSGINILLSGYGIETESVDIVPSKRLYVLDLLKSQSEKLIVQIASDLEIEIPKKIIQSNDHFKEVLESKQLHSVIDDFNRAFENLETDPEQAIASASSTLESICKAICDFFNEDYPKAQHMQPLIGKAYKLLNLSPDQHADEQIKKILGGLNSVATGIGTLRSKNSSAHGHGTKKVKLSVRHSRLVVNSCMTIGLFLLETYYDNHLVK